MPAPRVPTSLLEIRGAFEHNPERRKDRENEPKPTGSLGPAPRTFKKEEKKIWKELQEIVPPGVLTNADRWTVEIACVLMARQRAGTITSSDLGKLIALMSRMAMTPADRSRVGVEPAAKDEAEVEEFQPRRIK
jgi:hypothetical protein